MGSDKLQRGSGQQQLARTSPQQSTISERIAKCLDMAATMTQSEVPTFEASVFWIQELEAYPVEIVEQSFRDYLRESRWFPKLPDITERCKAKTEINRSDGTVQMMDELKAREAAGEKFYSMADLADEFKALLHKRAIQ